MRLVETTIIMLMIKESQRRLCKGTLQKPKMRRNFKKKLVPIFLPPYVSRSSYLYRKLPSTARGVHPLNQHQTLNLKRFEIAGDSNSSVILDRVLKQVKNEFDVVIVLHV